MALNPFALAALISSSISKKDNGDKRQNSANGEDITRVQIIALILHFLAFDVRRRRRGRWRTGGGRIQQRPFMRSIAKSARVPIPAVQNFRPRPSWQAAVHFSVYFCRDIWDRLRRFAGQVGLLSVPQAKTSLSLDSMPDLDA